MCSHSRFLTTGMQLSGEGNGNPLQYSCLGNPMDRGAWWAAVHGVAKSRTRLSDFTFTFHFHALEKEVASHSCVLAWRIPGTGAWWAAVYGVAQSPTLLTRLSSSSSSSLQLSSGREEEDAISPWCSRLFHIYEMFTIQHHPPVSQVLTQGWAAKS